MQLKQRILSIDVFRGITIFVMVFVNDLAGTPGVADWIGHMPADTDGMGFADFVFPAFLFIAGMSIPFAVGAREHKGDSFLQLQGHILWRVLGLLTLGFFMVNGEEGYSAVASGIPKHAWLLLFYAAAILTWNVYTFSSKWLQYLLRGLGIAGLALLALVYRGANGTDHMQPHWWGILGLIGWAYLYSIIIYQLVRNRLWLLISAIVACSVFYIISREADDTSEWLRSQAVNTAHTSIMLCGTLLSGIFFSKPATRQRKYFVQAFVFALFLLVAASLLRPWYKISKIYATPSWCLYSAAVCCIVFSFLYWLIDIRMVKKWTGFFQPAATNALLLYILPGILFSFFSLTQIVIFPQRFRYGWTGIGWSLFFSVLVMYMAKGLNKLKIKLQL